MLDNYLAQNAYPRKFHNFLVIVMGQWLAIHQFTYFIEYDKGPRCGCGENVRCLCHLHVESGHVFGHIVTGSDTSKETIDHTNLGTDSWNEATHLWIVHVCVCTCVCARICVNVCACECMYYVCLWGWVSVYVCVWWCVCMHTHVDIVCMCRLKLPNAPTCARIAIRAFCLKNVLFPKRENRQITVAFNKMEGG